ncbi:MAG: glycosyltransferase family 39 protein [Bacteroidetes bacterium]|nr:glycosyltransferase family 39 protein [Bacteroidota bacterium]
MKNFHLSIFIPALTPFIWIILFLFLLNFTWFYSILKINPSGFFSFDSYQYINLAGNILHHASFSQSEQPPLIQDPYRTPLYPLFLAVIYPAGSEIAVVILQILLSAGTVLLVCRITLLFIENKIAATLAGIFYALDIPTLVFNNQIMTETLFTFLLMLSVYFFLKFINDDSGAKSKTLFLSGFFLGLSILCRPIAIFLPLILILVLAGTIFRKKVNAPVRNFVYPVVAFTGPLLLTVLLWYIRNYLVFGNLFFSLIGPVNMCNFHGAAVYARVNNMEFYAAREKFWKELEEDAPVRISEDVTVYTKYIAGKSLKLMAGHPVTAIRNQVTGMLHLLFKPLRGDIDRQLGFVKGFTTITPLESDSGADIFSALPSKSGKITQLLVFYQFFWMIIVYCGTLLSMVVLFRRKNYLVLALVFGIIVYFTLVTTPPLTYARFRVPLIPLLAILGAIGLTSLFKPRIFASQVK